MFLAREVEELEEASLSEDFIKNNCLLVKGSGAMEFKIKVMA